MLEKDNSPFRVDKAEDSMGFLLWQTNVIWQRLIKQELEEYAISHSQFVIMASLMWFELHHIATTQITIIKWTKLDKMTVSKSLKTLVQSDLVKRVEHKTDTRAKSVSLTKSGKSLIIKLIPIVEKIDEKFFAKITSDEQQSFIKILRKLTRE
jgi:MarR family transcriptional regulator, organic hydroperoxide resistance regulator